MKKDISKRP